MAKTRQQPGNHGAVLAEPPASQATAANAPADVPERRESEQAAVLTMEQASMRHVGEWVLMRITGQDQDTGELYGEVLAHHRLRHVVTRAHRRACKADPQVHLAHILGGTRRITREEFCAMIDEAATKPYVNAAW